MEIGVNSTETRSLAGIAMEFPASGDGNRADSSSSPPPRMPPRLRRRLSEARAASPASVEEIEAKLRDADIRRQKFNEYLSSKARPKPRSPSQSPSQEENIGQRIEAKLQAAEQKRLSILAEYRRRLAKSDELRQAARTGAETRFRKQLAELGTKVESRVQQAEVNRMHILKAYKQRRATIKERSSQSKLRRIARESKYKERVYAAICQKRAEAEKKRLGLLDKKRACARVLQVRKVAKSVSQQRETERRILRDKLEDRLQRAMNQRVEYLMPRAGLYDSPDANWIKMQKEADLLSRKLARCWRRFRKLKRTTLDLSKTYHALNINERHVKSMPFEQLAVLIESNSTLQSTKAILDRLESRYKLSKVVASTTSSCRWDDIDHLLKRVASPKRRATPRTPAKSRGTKKPAPDKEASKTPVNLSRYQVRVVLCAYMILGHPDAVFSSWGVREVALAESAEKFVQEFEFLIKIILDGPMRRFGEKSDPAVERRGTFRSQLATFDAAWCSYLNRFVVWKVKDAESIEKDLVRAACRLELSMMHKCKFTAEGDSGDLTHDLKAIQKQVTEDQTLLREKVWHLSGAAGIERMECALLDTRSKYFQAREDGSAVGSPNAHILYPSSPGSPASPSSFTGSDKTSDVTDGSQRPNSVVRSLFKDDTSVQKEVAASSAHGSRLYNQFHHSGEKFDMENELIVNEAVHEQHYTFADSINVSDQDETSFKEKIRETWHKAFWDSIEDSMKQDDPNYDRVVELMREVRDEICEMAPQSWNKEITEAIDLDILSQVLNSGKLDTEYLGKILEFALVTLQKLSAPASEGELKTSHQKLLGELSEICQSGEGSNHSHVIALVKGLRFVLEEIQVLKQEISKARIRIMEPLLRGPAGLDYLEKAFAKRHGLPSDALTALPLTVQWLSSVGDSRDVEWSEHHNILELIRRQERSSQSLLPSTTLRTGGSFSVQRSGSQVSSFTSSTAVSNTTGVDHQHPECKGERVDLSVRLALLKLVSGVSGLTQDALPETLKLNLSRLRSVQAQLQKIIVIATSILVLRQTLLSEKLVTNVENAVLGCAKQLSELLDTVEDAGIREIVEVLSKISGDCDKSIDMAKAQSRKEVTARMLTKSLQARDAVFERVSRAVYLAARGVVLGGCGGVGRELAEMALRQVGAAVVTDRVVDAATVLVVAATVTSRVHGNWYAKLMDIM
ncbi:hypothetical protein RJ639_007302 [Escallonia herrerae]|uniref:T-complex protein 11 n=1 Tax=Escallonia herrerae TaxID=1293975 RepID=A0AA89AV27_9ASTE|nr:hypothetical protein RJ639_007302 [Escallonia herrerae]